MKDPNARFEWHEQKELESNLELQEYLNTILPFFQLTDQHQHNVDFLSGQIIKIVEMIDRAVGDPIVSVKQHIVLLDALFKYDKAFKELRLELLQSVKGFGPVKHDA